MLDDKANRKLFNDVFWLLEIWVLLKSTLEFFSIAKYLGKIAQKPEFEVYLKTRFELLRMGSPKISIFLSAAIFPKYFGFFKKISFQYECSICVRKYEKMTFVNASEGFRHKI